MTVVGPRRLLGSWIKGSAAAIVLIGLTAQCAAGATINVEGAAGGVTFVSISGEIVAGDAERFDAAVGRVSQGVVVLESPGGLISEALRIGATIRANGYSTLVAPDAGCYSACGLIWVSGDRRYMSWRSDIGFHAAYRMLDGEYYESGVANAEVGSFLTHLGFRVEAIRFFTVAGPTELLRLTPTDARRLGIDIYEMEGGKVYGPADRPTVDLFAWRFVALSFLSASCAELFSTEVLFLNREAEAAHKSGTAMLDADAWTRLFLMQLELMRTKIESRGTLLACIDTEADLRRSGSATGIEGPSFPCTSPETPSEQAICRDADLWAKDRMMNSIYLWVRRNMPPSERSAILTAQRAWLGYRDGCRGDAACLNTEYTRRLEDFRSLVLRF